MTRTVGPKHLNVRLSLNVAHGRRGLQTLERPISVVAQVQMTFRNVLANARYQLLPGFRHRFVKRWLARVMTLKSPDFRFDIHTVQAVMLGGARRLRGPHLT